MSDGSLGQPARDDVARRVRELGLSGRCCTQIMVQMALDEIGAENPQMVDAVGALCLGLFSGRTCGALTGGLLAMALRSSAPVDGELCEQLVEWFETEHGSLECDDLLKGDSMARFTTCPAIVGRTYEESMQLLAARGLLAP
jgi:hypothetical protein